MMKQVIVVRDDIGMSRGKLAAQCCHASLNAAKKAKKAALASWEKIGQKKIVLRAKDEKEIMKIADGCKEARIPFYVVSDAGLTELAPGTVTAIGIGPETEEKINRITGSLPLLD